MYVSIDIRKAFFLTMMFCGYLGINIFAVRFAYLIFGEAIAVYTGAIVLLFNFILVGIKSGMIEG